MYTAEPVSSANAQRIVVANRADGGVFYWLGKLYGFAAIVILWSVGVAGVSCYGTFAAKAPTTPDLARYSTEAPGVARIYAGDGTLLGEFAAEWREVTSFDAMPHGLVDAVLAAEDHEFFAHRGIYFRGIARAAWANVTAGDFAQGGSTITQQVAKQFLGSEKSLDRKAREAVLARRLEATYSKKAILSLYMNQIFLGNGAYGVAAAARRYFDKDLSELTVAEMATIAGLAQAPSRYDPLRRPDKAVARRNLVLDKMVRFGFLDAAEAETWKAAPLELSPPDNIYPRRLPYYTEHVRNYVEKKYGKDVLLERGLRIETAVQPVADGIAYSDVDFGARKQDKRQGWRGAEAYLEGKARETFRARAAETYGDRDLVPGRRYLALVDNVTARGAQVVVGSRTFKLPLANMEWASKWSRRNAVNDEVITDARTALRAGDVVWVAAEPRQRERFRDWYMPDGHNPRWLAPRTPEQMLKRRRNLHDRVTLEQVPHPQVAIFAADHRTGYVEALVGGYDFNRSVYNRAVQACRQPGSTYKPIYYSAALDRGYGFDSLLEDKPLEVIDPVTGEVWTPENLGGTIDNQVTLEYAMVFSKNVPSVHIFSKVGAAEVEDWARRLGFTTTIIADKALALGASCTVLPELTRAFAIFARNGAWVDWVYVRRIIDRNGVMVEDNTVPSDPMLSPAARLDRVAQIAGVEPRQAIPARAAYLTTKLLRQAIRHGFSSIVRATGIKAAGKTGTSSATMDTSFVGYTSRTITAVWMGDDMRERELGVDDAAYMTVVPLWTRFMWRIGAGDVHPNGEIPWDVPPGVKPGDRGSHDRGETGPRSDLVYRKAPKPDAGESTPPSADG